MSQRAQTSLSKRLSKCLIPIVCLIVSIEPLCSASRSTVSVECLWVTVSVQKGLFPSVSVQRLFPSVSKRIWHCFNKATVIEQAIEPSSHRAGNRARHRAAASLWPKLFCRLSYCPPQLPSAANEASKIEINIKKPRRTQPNEAFSGRIRSELLRRHTSGFTLWSVRLVQSNCVRVEHLSPCTSN